MGASGGVKTAENNKMTIKKRMDIETFLQKSTWAYEPCLYIVKQMFPGNNAYRCGAAIADVQNADRSTGRQINSFTGLLGRMTMCRTTGCLSRYAVPCAGATHASWTACGCGLVWASTIDRGNQTLVLRQEAEMHLKWTNRVTVAKGQEERVVCSARASTS